MIGKNLFEDDGLDVDIDVASEYRYRNIKYDKKTLVILISQSGETADTIAAMRMANEKGAETLIMEYYGRTILESYRNLHDIIENSRNQDKMKRLYLYYSKLYASAENKEKEILESIPNSEV